MYFQYGQKEKEYLAKQDAKMAYAIATIGHINRPVNPDLFSSVITHIIGQQISSVAQRTIRARMKEALGELTPQTLNNLSVDEIQSFGTSFRKAEYIKDFTTLVYNKEFDLEALRHLDDDEVIKRLSSLKGIGPWTAEMLLLFCLQRPDVLSYGDLAIVRGLRMLYNHEKIGKPLFEEYRKLFSPYGSVAGLYLWAIAGGQIPELVDPAPKKPRKQRASKKK